MASSTEIAALAVSLSLDAGNFSKQMSAITQSIKNVDKDFKSAGQGVKNFEDTVSGMGQKLTATQQKIDLYNQKLAAQEQQYNRLNSVFQQQNSRLQEIESTLGRGSQEWQNQAQLVQRNAQQLTNLDTAMNQTRGQVSQLNSVFSETESALNRLQQSEAHAQSFFGRLTQSAQDTANKMKAIGSSMKDFGQNMAITAGAGAAAIAAPLALAVKNGAEFEAEIAKVAAKASDSTSQIKGNEQELTKAAEKFAPLAGGASKAATAMDDLAAKGYNTKQVIAAMPSILDAANASGENLATTSDTITSALESFNLKGKKTSEMMANTKMVADTLTGAANASAAGMSDLAYTFNYAAAPAHQLGVNIQTLSAMTAIMANNGIKGEQAGTSLRMAFTRLVKPPKAAANEIHDLGIKIKDAHGNMRPMADIMEQLKTKTEHMTNAQKNAAIATIFGTNAYSAMIPLVNGGAKAINDMTAKIVKSGDAHKQAQIMQDNFAGSLKKLQGAVDAAQISIEQNLAPALRVIADTLTSLIAKFQGLDPHTQKFIVIGAAIAAVVLTMVAALGTFIALLGNVIGGIGTLIGWGVKIAPMFEAAGAAIAGISAPVWIAVAVIAAIGIGIYEMIQHWDVCKKYLNDLKVWFAGVWNSIKTNTMAFLNSTGQYFSQKWSEIKSATASAGSAIGNALSKAWNSIKSGTVSIWNSIVSFFRQWGPLMLAALAGPLGILVYEIAAHWNQIKSAAISAWNGIKSAVVSAANGLKSGVSSVISGIKGYISSVWSGIYNVLTHPFESAKNTIASIIGGIKSSIGGIGSAIGRILTVETPEIVAPPAPAAAGALATAEGPVGMMATGGSIMDSVSELSSSIGGTSYSGGLYSSNASVIQAAASTKADTQAMIAGLSSQNKNLETQNSLLMQMVQLLQAGQQIAVNVDGKQIATATSSYMDNALRRSRDSKTRARGGK